MPTSFLLYGATGYTGELTARLARRHGLRPLLAGRDAGAIRRLAAQLGLDGRVIDLERTAALDGALESVDAVLHCAGPFLRTFRPVVEACIRTGTNYLDLTGEVAVLRAIADEDSRARRAGVTLLPAVGFDVVPTDCLARHLARRLPGGRRLVLAFRTSTRPSRGTILTLLEQSEEGTAVVREGELTWLPLGSRTRRFDFGDGPEGTIAISWGDLVTARHSTDATEIAVYVAASGPARLGVRTARYLGPLRRSRPLRRWLRRRVERWPRGPSEEERMRGESRVLGSLERPDGRRVEAHLIGPDAYTFTAHAALLAVRKVLGGEAPVGFCTPASAFGPDFVLDVPGTSRTDH